MPEGDGPVSVMVNMTADRPFVSPGSVWVHITGFGSGRGSKLTFPAGSSGVVAQVNVSWVGDDVFSLDRVHPTSVRLGAVAGLLTGSYRGGVAVLEDDPRPAFIYPTEPVVVTEGQPLVWNIQMTAPRTTFDLFCRTAPVWENQTELSSADVPSKWIYYSTGGDDPPLVPAPLSSVNPRPEVRFNYGDLLGVLRVPTVADDDAGEGERAVAFVCDEGSGPFTLRGIVADSGKVL